ncbi:tetratricopeptide repeat protein [Magnetospirillum sulfuroxidans]|uniref:Tetratricopeptide repeat protein n=1 Tax=Magnetospirillum sulfuroxidans TaxID=611300 RepID=A0ABS5I970_9PROT|nr:tetratricopeptide repeat protein [Magnetospirillum sulfuroxidans]
MTSSNDDAATDVLIREVDDDLRQENLEKLWKKYGALIIGGALAVVLAVAGAQAWRTWQHNQGLQSSVRFNEANQMLDGADKAKGLEALQGLADAGTSGYRVLSEMKLAQVKLAAGDAAGAAALYDRIAATSEVEGLYRDMAVLKSAYLKIETADAALVEKSVTPLAVEASPWRHSAREVLALLALRAGDRDKALELLRKVADDVAAPTGIRGRAAELLAALESAAKG